MMKTTDTHTPGPILPKQWQRAFLNERLFAGFSDIYHEELARAVREHNDEYGFPLAQTSIVADKILAAVRLGNYNKDGRAFRATCRRLQIPHTYTAIRAYLMRTD